MQVLVGVGNTMANRAGHRKQNNRSDGKQKAQQQTGQRKGITIRVALGIGTGHASQKDVVDPHAR